MQDRRYLQTPALKEQMATFESVSEEKRKILKALQSERAVRKQTEKDYKIKAKEKDEEVHLLEESLTKAQTEIQPAKEAAEEKQKILKALQSERQIRRQVEKDSKIKEKDEEIRLLKESLAKAQTQIQPAKAAKPPAFLPRPIALQKLASEKKDKEISLLKESGQGSK